MGHCRAVVIQTYWSDQWVFISMKGSSDLSETLMIVGIDGKTQAQDGRITAVYVQPIPTPNHGSFTLSRTHPIPLDLGN